MKTKIVKKSEIILSVLFLSMILTALSVSAATTLTTNTGATTLGCDDFRIFNITTTDVVNGQDQTINISLYAKSSLTAQSSWTLLGKNLTFNVTLDANRSVTSINLTGLLEDANNYIFNATIQNNTNSIVIASATLTGITVDCTAPTAPTLSPASNNEITSSTTQTFTGTVDGSKTTSCTYVIARNGASSGSDYITGIATHTANTCSFTKSFTSTTDNGNWYWSITASDETNTSQSPTNIFNAQLAASNGGLPINSQGQIVPSVVMAEDNTLIWAIGIILGIIIIIAVLWIIF